MGPGESLSVGPLLQFACPCVLMNGSALCSLAPKASQLLTQGKMWQVVLKGFSAGSVLEPG